MLSALFKQPEILVMFSTANAFHRLEQAGGIQLLKEAAMQRRVKIRILTPEDELIPEPARKLMMLNENHTNRMKTLVSNTPAVTNQS